ncbi:hypothetical protein ACFQE0_18100 [Methylobacterium komagatae]|uniref:Uncharacterized protein n=1 Tax=Methylobacterium komagatae TaxID=374425 RepID=A0ABW2BLP8_9HYPH
MLIFALALGTPYLALLDQNAQSVAILAVSRESLDAAIRSVAEADGEIVAIAAGHVLYARSDRSGFTSRLHASGRWLVLPAMNAACNNLALPENI